MRQGNAAVSVLSLIGRGIDGYFQSAFSKAALPDSEHVYVEIKNRTLKTFCYSSEAPDAPILTLSYGGGWHHGNRWQLATLGRDLSRRGMTVYLPEYRVASRDGASVADALSDLRKFHEWVRDRHPKNRILVGGSSAGGFLAASLALSDPPQPNGLVLINPAVNLSRDSLTRVWPLLEQPKTFGVGDLVSLDPVRRLDETPPRILVLHGTRDVVVPIKRVEEFIEKAISAGGACSLIRFPGYGHGFVNEQLFPKAHRRAVEEIVKFVGAGRSRTG